MKGSRVRRVLRRLNPRSRKVSLELNNIDFLVFANEVNYVIASAFTNMKCIIEILSRFYLAGGYEG